MSYVVKVLGPAVKRHENISGVTEKRYVDTEYYRRALAARDLIKSLIPKSKKVYLNFDDLVGRHSRGKYGRPIAVVYTKLEGNWVNLNARLLRQGYPKYTKITTFESEFNPYNWLDNEYPYV